MFGLLMVIVAATPVDVVVGTGDVNGLVVTKALARVSPGAAPKDLSALFDALSPAQSLLGFSDFGNFQARPPSTWPSALSETWRSSLATCATIAGPPPWREHLLTVMGCSTRLSEYLWQRVLEDAHATRVLVVAASKDAQHDRLALKVTTYQAAGTTQVVVEYEGSSVGTQGLVEAAVKKALAGDGASQPRPLVPTLLDERKDDPFVPLPVVTTPVKLSRPCEALPRTLRLDGQGTLAQSVLARWAASVSGTAPAVDCTLTTFTHLELVEGQTLPIASVALNCAHVTMSAQVALSAVAKRSPIDMASERLVSGMASRLCP